MNVLSLFDGMSCGQQALKELGIEVTNYYASEVDKYAIQIAKKNHPNTIHIGDVTKVSYKDGILTTENGEFEVGQIDLVIAGSPCQGFSFAGKQLNFEDPRSKLFFDFTRILKETNPKNFMLENVRMKQEFKDVISDILEVEPIAINSRLVSAQNRPRLYWTNLNTEQPEDRGILLKDIIESWDGESVARQVGRRINAEGKRDDYNKDIKPEQRIEPRLDDKSGTITTVQKDNLVINAQKGIVEDKYYLSDRMLTGFANAKPPFRDRFNPHTKDTEKSYCLTARYFKMGKTDPYIKDDRGIRKLTPIECERLQTLPDGYTEGVSNTQRYKMLGNGWTVATIKHIFKNLKAAG